MPCGRSGAIWWSAIARFRNYRAVAFPLSTTAIVHGTTIVTAKPAAFEATGAALVDPCAET